MAVVKFAIIDSEGDVADASATQQIGLNQGGTASDLSATGGSNQIVRQNTVGGALTVSVLATGDLPTGIPATNIHDGSISNTEFGYLNNVSSNIQTQLDAKVDESLVITTTAPLTINGTTSADLSTGRTIAIPQANGSTDGFLDSADWTTFNSKQPGDAQLTEFAALSFVEGDLVTVDSASDIVRLAVGTIGQVLTSDGNGPVWDDPAMSDPASFFTADNDNGGTIVKGQCVYMKSDGDIDLARANATGTSILAGVVQDTSVTTGSPAKIQTDGKISQTTGAWDALTGGTGGLTPGAIYYMSVTTPGMLQTAVTVTGGQQVVKVLLALSATEALVLPQNRIKRVT